MKRANRDLKNQKLSLNSLKIYNEGRERERVSFWIKVLQNIIQQVKKK